MNSLRHKIVLGYLFVGALFVLLSLLAYSELSQVGQQIDAGSTVDAFHDATLEMRRFEKNLFLYHQEADWHENAAHLRTASALLRERRELFVLLSSEETIRRQEQVLATYQSLMAKYPGSGQPHNLENSIRSAGKEAVTLSEALARVERNALQEALQQHRQKVLISIAVLTILVMAAGHLMAQEVIRPLRRMEESMKAVAGGRYRRLDLESGDREIVSLTEAFNHVLSELDVRQKHMVRSEKLASLGTLLSGVAHELNNPLSNISTSCQILAEEIDSADREFQRDLILQIDEQTLRARDIVRSLLEFSRRRPGSRSEVAVGPLVAETMQFLRGQRPEGVIVRHDVPDDLVVFAEKSRLQQLLLNLVKNATEACGESGQVAISARRFAQPRLLEAPWVVFGAMRSEGGVAEIVVEDDGPGIPPDVLPRIFDPFFTTKDVGKGSGLGLYVVNEIVEEHGGLVAVKSVSGAGCTFLVRLPLSAPRMPGEGN